MHTTAAKTQPEKNPMIEKPQFWPIKKAKTAVFQPQKFKTYK